MLKDCFYPFTDFIVPHYDSKNVNTLQYMCAISLTTSRDLLQYYIRKIPPKLFPYLFKSVVHHTFSQSKSGRVAWFTDSIVLLIHHWPFETFVLRDLLTSGFLPVTLNKHINLRTNQETFKSFIEKLVTVLIKAFIYESNGIVKKIGKFDISGVGVNVEEIFTLPIFQNAKREDGESVCLPNKLICDVYFVHLEKYSSYLKEVLPSAGNKKDSTVVSAVFDAVCIASLPAKNIINIIHCISKMTKIRYLELSLCSIEQQFIEKLSTSGMSKALEGLSMSYCMFNNYQLENYNFNFLRNFKKLHQLDLSGISSKCPSGWSILGDLPNGLTYLKMVGCAVKKNDFNYLMKHSKHSKTLIQLDLSENHLSDDECFLAFTNFVGSLEKIRVLELQNCKLEKVPTTLLESFRDTLITNCPELTVLQLLENDFSYSFLLQKFITIVQKPSLRLLCLTMPSDVYLVSVALADDDYEIVNFSMSKLKSAYNNASMDRSGPQLCFEWKEETSYSHWFYSVR